MIRALAAFERDVVKRFYLALSEDDRRMRLCATASDETVSKYIDRLDFAQATLFGAFDERAQMIGLAELVHGVAEGEMAFVVRTDMRRQKIGARLMEKLLVHARMCGIQKVVVMFFSENTPMRRVALRAGMHIRAEGAECNAFLELEAPRAEEVKR